jgi:predicted peptidase
VNNVSRRTALAIGTTLGLAAVAAVSFVPTTSTAAPAAQGSIVNVVPITEVLPFGQKVTAVAIEYSQPVNARELSPDTFKVSDSTYNFRFHPIGDLSDPTKRADREVTAIYTNDDAARDADQQSDPGRFVIVELDPDDAAGNTVYAWLGGVRVNTDLQTQVVQQQSVYAQPGNGQGRGPLLAAASGDVHGPTQPAVNDLADDFVYERFVGSTGTMLPYAYHLPDGYDAASSYPVVVILPGQGMGYRADAEGLNNEGVQVAADNPATAWLQPDVTGSDEDVIVLAPQNQRIGSATVQSELMVELVNDFSGKYAVDQDRIYASTVSYGSTLAWAALTNHPGLFDAALITGGFAASAAQATAIAVSGTPVWVTHGTTDHLLNVVTTGQTSFNRLWNAYIALGKTPAQASALVKYTEYGDEAFGEPDEHLAAAPTYEDDSILQWLLAQ